VDPVLAALPAWATSPPVPEPASLSAFSTSPPTTGMAAAASPAFSKPFRTTSPLSRTPVPRTASLSTVSWTFRAIQASTIR
jgi:hypothetical protein